jgi:hypothetical protein
MLSIAPPPNMPTLHLCGAPMIPQFSWFFIFSREVFKRMSSTEDVVLFHGGCHCGKIRFQVSTTSVVDVYNCKYVQYNTVPQLENLTPCMKFLSSYILECHIIYLLFWKTLSGNAPFFITLLHLTPIIFVAVAFVERNRTCISLFQMIPSNSFR